MELFAKIINGWKPLTIFAKTSILDVQIGSGCTPGSNMQIKANYIFTSPGFLYELKAFEIKIKSTKMTI